MSSPEQETFDCAAYGPEGREAGALCFMSGELHERVCEDQAQCQEAMTAERQRVFSKIQAGAAAGDPDMTYLAAEFTHPDQLLGGQLEEPQACPHESWWYDDTGNHGCLGCRLTHEFPHQPGDDPADCAEDDDECDGADRPQDRR